MQLGEIIFCNSKSETGSHQQLGAISNLEQSVTRSSRQLRIVGATGSSRLSHWTGPGAANAKNMEQISELGGSGVIPPGKYFLTTQNAANWAIFFFSFLSGLKGEAWVSI